MCSSSCDGAEAAKRHLVDVLPSIDLDATLDEMRLRGLIERVGRAGGTQYRPSSDVIRRAGVPAGGDAYDRPTRLLREIERLGSLSTAEAASLLAVDRAVARNILNDLAAAGKARPVGKTRAPLLPSREKQVSLMSVGDRLADAFWLNELTAPVRQGLPPSARNRAGRRC